MTTDQTKSVVGFPTRRWASFFRARDDWGIAIDVAGETWSTGSCHNNYRHRFFRYYFKQKRQWVF